MKPAASTSPKRTRLSAADYEAIIRLVAEIGEIGPAAPARRQHFLNSVGQLLHTQPGGVVHIRTKELRGGEPVVVDRFDGKHRLVGTYRGPVGAVEGAGDSPPAVPMLFSDRGPFYRSAAWERGEGPFRLPARLDEGAFSRVWTASGDHFGTVFVPEEKGPGFTERQREILRLAFGACWRLLLAEMTPVRSPLEDLSPRLRRVAERLLTGDSTKQVARQLGLSVHTVSQYTKLLHRQFGVSSRSELLLALMGRRSSASNGKL